MIVPCTYLTHPAHLDEADERKGVREEEQRTEHHEQDVLFVNRES